MTVEYFIFNYVPIGKKIKILEAVFATENEPSHFNELFSGQSRHRNECGYYLDKYLLNMITTEEDYLIIQCEKVNKE